MSSGRLFVVGTPIGNMEDITLRALRVLREISLVAAEDTRHTGMLLARHSIKKPLVSYHEFNEAKRTAELLRELQQGRSIALVSDAGMPTVSDPGQRLIRAAIDAGIPVEVIPGVSAITTAWVASGFPLPVVRGSPRADSDAAVVGRAREFTPTPRSGPGAPHSDGDGRPGGPSLPLSKSGAFLFFGFLPHKSGQRRNALTRLAPLPCALVFFESPYRLVKSLQDMHDQLGNRPAVVARELTKKFEEILRGDLAAILKKLENRSVKGEITVIVEGCRE